MIKLGGRIRLLVDLGKGRLAVPYTMHVLYTNFVPSKRALLKADVERQCSMRMVAVSVSMFPMGPMLRTKWPLGYCEPASQESIRTTILWEIHKEVVQHCSQRTLNTLSGLHFIILLFKF